MHVCLWQRCVPGARWGLKNPRDSPYMTPRNLIQSSARTANALNHWTIAPNPWVGFLYKTDFFFLVVCPSQHPQVAQTLDIPASWNSPSILSDWGFLTISQVPFLGGDNVPWIAEHGAKHGGPCLYLQHSGASQVQGYLGLCRKTLSQEEKGQYRLSFQ